MCLFVCLDSYGGVMGSCVRGANNIAYFPVWLTTREAKPDPNRYSRSWLHPIRIFHAYNDLISLRAPTRFITKYTNKKARETRAWLGIPLEILGYGLTVGLAWDTVTENKLSRLIEEKAEKFNALIDTDFRFIQIKDLRDAGEITPEQARRIAYNLYREIALYHEDLRPRFQQPLTDELRQEFLDSLLFMDERLRVLLKSGVSKVPNFDVPEDAQGPVSKAKIDKIIATQVKLFDELLYFHGKMEEKPSLLDLENDPIFASDDFSRALIHFYKLGAISETQFAQGLKENAYWKSTFEIWATLGMTPKPVLGDTDQNGQFTLDDLQLMKVRALHGTSVAK